MDIRTEIEYDRELQRRIAKYKNPRPATREEIEEMISRFRNIGTSVFVKAANIMESHLAERSEK